MAISVVLNGVTYTIPQTGEEGWGSNVTDYLSAIPSGVLQKTGGAFTLSANVNFGPTYGLLSKYLSTRTASPSSVGLVRLAVSDSIGWRNNADDGNLLLAVNGSNGLTFNGSSVIAGLSIGALDAQAANATGLALSGSVLSAQSADGTHPGMVNITAQTFAGAKTFSSTIVGTTSGNTTITPNQYGVVVSGAANAMSVVAPDASTAKTLVSGGVAANPSWQTINAILPFTTTGDLLYSPSGATSTRLPIGSANQVLQSVGGIPSWQTVNLSGINYISANPSAEVNTTGWVTYADAAGNIPVNGVGGSPNITWTRTTSSPLRGSASFLYTRTAANRQGEGVAFDFTIDAADCAKPLAINFDYVIASGTFFAADGITPPLNDGTTSQNAGMSDLEVFIYDVTNSALIPVSPQVLTSSSAIPETFKGIFQTNSTSTSYRLIIHTARSTAVAETVKFDNFFVGPQSVAYGSAITDWSPVTVTGSWIANTTYTAYERRVGDSYEYDIMLALSGAPTSATLTVNLPSGRVIDTAKVASGTNTSADSAIQGRTDISRGSAYSGTIQYSSTTAVKPTAVDTNGNVNAITQASPGTFANGDSVHLWFKVPIAGFSSTTLMSNDTDTRVVAAQASGTTTTINNTGSGQTVIFPTVATDTHGTYNSSTGIYTIPVSGKYFLSSTLLSGSLSWIAGSQIIVQYQVNSGSVTEMNRTVALASSTQVQGVTGSAILSLVSGDTVKIVGFSTTSNALTSGTLSIQRLTGPASIAATESVNVRATNTAGTSLPDGTQVPWGTITFDSHNEMNVNGTYTIPISGKYSVNATIQYNSFNLTTAQVCFLTIKKTGVVSSTGPTQYGTGAGANLSAHVEDTLACVAGDTITIVANSQATGTLATTATVNHIAITRVGN